MPGRGGPGVRPGVGRHPPHPIPTPPHLTSPALTYPRPRRLGVCEEAGHDAVLLMDRVMSTSLQLAPDLLDLLAVGCVVIAAKQVDGPGAGAAPGLPPDADLAAASGLPVAAVEQMEWNIRQVLVQVRV